MPPKRDVERDNPPKAPCLILGEQHQLVNAEREILAMIEKVNGQLNQLLVSNSTLLLKHMLIFPPVGRRAAAQIQRRFPAV